MAKQVVGVVNGESAGNANQAERLGTSAKSILSISYDPSLLWTRQQMLQQLGYSVVSVEGFVAGMEACEAPNLNFDLLILGHSMPTKDRERIIAHFRQNCNAPILALLRPHEGAMQNADRSIDPEPDKLIEAVREILCA